MDLSVLVSMVDVSMVDDDASRCRALERLSIRDRWRGARRRLALVAAAVTLCAAFVSPARIRSREAVQDRVVDTTGGAIGRGDIIVRKAATGGTQTATTDPSAWELHRWYIVGLVLVIVGQGSLIVGLIVQRDRRRRAEQRVRQTEDRYRLAEEELRAIQAQAQQLAGRIISAQEAERTRIARDLHDDASQQVAALSIGLGIAKRDLEIHSPALRAELTRLQDQAIALGEQIRHFSHQLHPGVLQRAGLIAALRDHCAEFSEQHGVYVDFQAGQVGTLSADRALCLYRVAQETLHNIGKHAYATRVDVELRRTECAIDLTISDNGRGFDPATIPTNGGLGLVSLKERVRLLSGTFTLTTHPNQGTIVNARLPDEGEGDAAL